ncbi:MAG: YtxH domain-containing protein [Chitinophagaceae bacterium]
MKNDSKLLWIGIIIGAAAGAGLAVLVSSDKGKEIIDDIKETAGKAEDEVRKAIHNLEETVYKGKELAGRLEKKAGKIIKQYSH